MNVAWRERWIWYVAGLGLLVFFWLLGPVLLPFVIGAGLAYLGDPIVDRLQRWGLSRTAGVAAVFVGLSVVGIVAAVLVIPMLYQQSLALLANIPDWLAWIQDIALPWLGIHLPDGMHLDAPSLKKILTEHWTDAGGVAAALWANVSKSGAAIAALAANLLLVPIVTFYLLRDWDDLVAWLRNVIPPRVRPVVDQLATETDQVMGSFIRGQLSVMLALAVLYSVGLAIAGLKLALVIGFWAGILSFVPYLGFAVGFVAGLLAMLVQEQSLLPLVWVAIVFGIGQILESWWLTPTLVGDRIGLHPVAVIFALMAGGQLFGFVGVLLALPGSAAIAVLLRHAKQRWLLSPMYLEGSAPEPLEPSRDSTQAPAAEPPA
ncbi:AI-2E family transporter [Sinimarinibacterium sp. CAU 1509]|uniref:AI-2E family transporter n=1 Tax=Sinimarinibacterium sp. CAU 1509 TaxID=2562283 RepID=UPI0010ACA623|nr:AI-2E family transporter [Sinimarinibacterium sp. CAU 1509]TJY61884.1 AI-2E family transporter [Sinimarinibacterium sp. CAU 1509]